MDGLFLAFFVWCCQFVVVSTVFLTTSYWLLGRSRRQKLEQNRTPHQAALSTLQESCHVTHRA
ncbi:MAG: hypothetical protein DWI21_10335 [Planctomycetota bacterium]|nr:MAG: hypothetical protein DWI21_10335 [Planctomycetota bacterium]